MSAPAGWYDDGAGRQRWWDGTQWTEHFAPAQVAAHSTPASVSNSSSSPISPNSVAPVRATPVVGFVGLGLAVLGTILACIPAVFGVGAVVLIAGFVVSLIGVLTKNGARWPSIAGMILSVVGGVIVVALAIWFAFNAQGPGPVDPSSAPTETAPTEPGSEGSSAAADEFPIGSGYLVSLTIRTETLEPPTGIAGEPPTEAAYSLDWGPAVDTDGQVAVVTATIRNTGETAERSVASVSLMSRDLDKYEPLSPVQGFDMNLLNLDVAPGAEQTLEFAYAMPAPDLANVVVEVFLQTDIGEGHRITAFQPRSGQRCEEMVQTELPEVAFWSCLRVTE